MTYEEALVIVEELRGRGRAPFSIKDKELVTQVYPVVMGRKFRRTSCPNCYRDAVIEMSIYLNRNKMLREKCDYVLRGGFIIRTPLIDNGKVYTNSNLTNEVAEKYLELFPQKRDIFNVIPEKAEKTPEKAEKKPTKASVQPKSDKAKKARSKSKQAKK